MVHYPLVIVDHHTNSQDTTKISSKSISCKTNNCGSCKILTNKSHVISYQTKHYHEIPDIYSCYTTGAIYLLECYKQYVGESGTTIRNRLKHHKNIYSSQTNRPIYQHPKTHNTDFSIYKLTIIDQESNTNLRKIKETNWIQKLRTKVPFGFNVIQKANEQQKGSHTIKFEI